MILRAVLIQVDDDLRRRLETKLIIAILDLDLT